MVGAIWREGAWEVLAWEWGPLLQLGSPNCGCARRYHGERAKGSERTSYGHNQRKNIPDTRTLGAEDLLQG